MYYAPLGMISESYLLFGRRIPRRTRGTKVEVYFVPARAVWPTQLNVYVEADIGTVMAIGRQRPLLGCQHCARLEVVGADLAGLQMYAQEEERAGHFWNCCE